jgi:hypothetical protein
MAKSRISRCESVCRIEYSDVSFPQIGIPPGHTSQQQGSTTDLVTNFTIQDANRKTEWYVVQIVLTGNASVEVDRDRSPEPSDKHQQLLIAKCNCLNTVDVSRPGLQYCTANSPFSRNVQHCAERNPETF